MGKYHGPDKLSAPDYKTYQVGEHTPQLLQVEKTLAAKGLKVKSCTSFVTIFFL
jgi:hypothetical protein